jgi:hypothetical protein
MAINTQSLFRQKQVQFGAGSSPARFTADFLTAVNRAQRDLATRSGVESTAIADINTDVGLDAEYEPYLSAIIDYHLLVLGHNPGMEINVVAMTRNDALRDAQMKRFEADTTLVTKLDIDS